MAYGGIGAVHASGYKGTLVHHRVERPLGYRVHCGVDAARPVGPCVGRGKRFIVKSVYYGSPLF